MTGSTGTRRGGGGAGGSGVTAAKEVKAESAGTEHDHIKRPPMARPPFSLADVRAAIPAHCFERSTVRSLGYVARDLACVALVAWAGSYIPALPFAWRMVAWPAYWYAMGLVLTGLWVLAHECGHQAFSPFHFVNDTVGWVLHSALGVPYWSWKYSHGLHHMNTCSMENDEVFIPATRSSFAADMINDTPLANLLGVITMLVVGWYVACIARRTAD